MKPSLSMCRRSLLLVQRLHSQSRNAATFSPLATALNKRPKRKLSTPFKKKQEDVGLFCIPELTSCAGFKVLEERCIKQVQDLINEACSSNRTRKMVVILDEMSDSLCRVADMADFVKVGHPDMAYRQAAKQTVLNLGEIVEQLNTNEALYNTLKDVTVNGDIMPLTDADQRVAELFLFDFEQSGIHLDTDKREKFVKINEKIMKLGNIFTQLTQTSTPMDYKYTMDKELYSWSTQEAQYGFMNIDDHPREHIREGSYRMYYYPIPSTEQILTELLDERHKLAELVGFSTFADRALRGTLAETPENVMKFLEALSSMLKEGAEADYKIMLEDKLRQRKNMEGKKNVLHKEIKPWDTRYFTLFAKANMFNDDRLSEYFSLGQCMDGLNNLFEKLFDVSLENVEPDPGETWHYDVYKLAVTHKTEGILGYIYCDFFHRESKIQQDCHFTIQCGRMLESGEYQLPKVVLHLNLDFPTLFAPCFLRSSHLENLFHEFGHAMHSMLARTQYQHVSGTRCSIDFAEASSVLMEYFASDPRVLSTFAKHYVSGEPVKEEDLLSYCYTKRRFLYSEYQYQVFFSILDQVLHGKQLPYTTTELAETIQNEYYGLEYIKDTAVQLRFTHLVGYGGKYYSYLMSRAIASKIWRQCFMDEPFNREMGEIYRRKVLAHGGERHPKELIQDLTGEEPTIDSMVQSFTEDLKARALL